jgi:ABC-type antimicrobial peptide transport system permease subunit
MYIIAVKKLVGASFASISGDIIGEYVSFSSIGVVLGLIFSFLLRFTPFADSDEVFFMSYSVPSVGAMFVITVLLSMIVSIIPIIRVYRYDLSQSIK